MNRWQCGLVAGVLGLSLATMAKAAAPGSLPSCNTSEMTPAQSLQLSLDLAATLERMEKYPEAVTQYERVLAIDGNNQQATRRLGVLCSKTGQFDRADAYFQKAAAGQPRNANVQNDWGRSYYLRGNWTMAEKKFRKALQIEPTHRLATNNLALTLGQEKRYSEAFQIFRAGGLSEAQSHCNLAFILWSQGRMEEARKACTLAKQLDPNCHKADELLAQFVPSEHAQIEKTSYQPATESAGSGSPKPAATEPMHGLEPAPDFTKPPVTTPAAGTQPVYQSPDGRKWFQK